MQKYAILIFFVIKEHQFSRNVLDEDNLNKSDALKTLSAYYGMFNKLLKLFILLEDSINRSENFDEIVGKDLNDLPRINVRIPSYSGPRFPAFGLNAERYWGPE